MNGELVKGFQDYNEYQKKKFYYRKNLFRKFFRRLTDMKVEEHVFRQIHEDDIKGYCLLFLRFLILFSFFLT